MFVKAPATHAEMTLEEQRFDYWLFVEIVMIFATVESNIIFLFIRSLERTKLEFSFGTEIDEEQDFVSTIETQFFVNLFSIVIVPLMEVVLAQKLYFEHRQIELTEKTNHMLNFQYIILGIQAAFVFHVTFVILRTRNSKGCWNKCGPVVSWIFTHVGLILCPLCNIGYFAYHWITGYGIMDDDFIVGPWLFCYAVMGVF